MVMLKRILIGIPMESIPQKALSRAEELCKATGADIFVTYIIEDNVFKEFSRQGSHVISEKGKEDIIDMMTKQHKARALNVIKPDVENRFQGDIDDFTIKTGMYSDALLESASEKNIDLIMIEYESFSLLKYRIMDRSSVPVWIEKNDRKIRNIGLFCSNISPNRHAPAIAKHLSKSLRAKLHSNFIYDPSGDSDPAITSDLSSEFRLKFDQVVEEKVDHYIYQKSKAEQYDLIILGRIRKKGYFHLRSKFAKKINASVLLVN